MYIKAKSLVLEKVAHFVLKGSGPFSHTRIQDDLIYNKFNELLRILYTKSLRRSAYWREEAIEQLQDELLHTILLAACRTVPFWTNKFQLSTEKITKTPPREVLRSLPIIQKADLRKAGTHATNTRLMQQFYSFDWLPNPEGTPQRFWVSSDFSIEVHGSNCDGHNYGITEYHERGEVRKFTLLTRTSYPKPTGGTCFRDITSGSTGEPFVFFLDKNFALRAPGLYTRIFEMAGGQEGDIFIRFSAKDRPFPTGLTYFPCPLFPYIPKRVSQLAEFLKGKTAVLYATASVLLETARTVRMNKIQMRLRAVVAASEAVSREEQKLIEEILGCPLVRSYATRELGWLAQECSERGMHINSEWAFIEIIDVNDTPLPRDTVGRIVVTTFNNMVMPFIRYDTGDLGAILSRPCRCGRTLPLLQFTGRDVGLLLLPGGRVMHHFDLLSIFYQSDRVELIRKFQIVQQSEDLITILVVPFREFSKGEVTSLQKDLRNILGSKTHFEIKIVNNVTGSGPKRKIFISRLLSNTPFHCLPGEEVNYSGNFVR